jgi:hypothetical protein
MTLSDSIHIASTFLTAGINALNSAISSNAGFIALAVRASDNSWDIGGSGGEFFKASGYLSNARPFFILTYTICNTTPLC